ncbi:MAG: TetR/AcrR family transcriptional regulator [Dehalococcoidales bacterium]|nr:TetR/AcrR family transcriptional regulator [Dehalococcoidales bacterium]
MADRASRKKMIAEKRREQIIEAASRVFTHKGFSAATVPEIAREAGVASGTIYLYFSGKRDLFIAVILETIITLPLLKMANGLAGADFVPTLKNILHNRLDLVRDGNIARLASLMGEIQRDQELRTIFYEKIIGPFFSKMENIYRQTMVPGGPVRPLETSILVRAVGGTILGFIMLRILEMEHSPLETLPREQVVDTLAEYILHGLMGAGD